MTDLLTFPGVDPKLDLAFLVDGSQVVTEDNFTHFLSFIKALTASFDVSVEETHVGVVVYGDVSNLVIDFNSHFNQTSLEDAIDNITYPESRQSIMGHGLSLVASGLFGSSPARPNVTKVLVILTASKSQDDIEVPSFNLLSNNSVAIFGIGVGSQFSSGQLREMSSNPDSQHVFTFKSGRDLAVEINSLKDAMGEGKEEHTYAYVSHVGVLDAD